MFFAGDVPTRNLEEAEAGEMYTWVTNGLPVTAGELCERLWSDSRHGAVQVLTTLRRKGSLSHPEESNSGIENQDRKTEKDRGSH